VNLLTCTFKAQSKNKSIKKPKFKILTHTSHSSLRSRKATSQCSILISCVEIVVWYAVFLPLKYDAPKPSECGQLRPSSGNLGFVERWHVFSRSWVELLEKMNQGFTVQYWILCILSICGFSTIEVSLEPDTCWYQVSYCMHYIQTWRHCVFYRAQDTRIQSHIDKMVIISYFTRKFHMCTYYFSIWESVW
jgi:hypothetical protein